MEFEKLLYIRQSVRSYDTERTVEKEKIQKCLEAARLTPSACNSQTWRFTVCQGKKAKEIANCVSDAIMNKWATQVPVFVVVSEESYNVTSFIGSKIKGQGFKSLDIGSAALQFCLAAADEGLGTCILGWFKQRSVQKAIGIHRKVHLVIALGYAKEGYKLRPKIRKPLEEIVQWIE